MDYKIYVLDSAGRISVPPVAIECSNDTEALEQLAIMRRFASHNAKFIAKLETDK